MEIKLILSLMVLIVLYSSLRLRSLFAFFGWMLMVIVLILTQFTTLSIDWFWLTAIAEIFILMLAFITYVSDIE